MRAESGFRVQGFRVRGFRVWRLELRAKRRLKIQDFGVQGLGSGGLSDSKGGVCGCDKGFPTQRRCQTASGLHLKAAQGEQANLSSKSRTSTSL